MTMMIPKTPTTYSCRAELSIDALRFVALMHDVTGALTDDRFHLARYEDLSYGDGFSDHSPLLEFVTTFSVAALLQLLRRVDDAHVMQETLRAVPLAENSLERDWDVMQRLQEQAVQRAEDDRILFGL